MYCLSGGWGYIVIQGVLPFRGLGLYCNTGCTAFQGVGVIYVVIHVGGLGFYCNAHLTSKISSIFFPGFHFSGPFRVQVLFPQDLLQ